MSKELPYFRFTVAEWMNGDISMQPKEVKSDFADICAFYWFKDCSLTLAKLKQKFSNATKSVDILIRDTIIKYNKETDEIRINFLFEQYDKLSRLHKDRQLAGQKGGYSKAKAQLQQKSGYKDKDKNKERDSSKPLSVLKKPEETKAEGLGTMPEESREGARELKEKYATKVKDIGV